MKLLATIAFAIYGSVILAQLPSDTFKLANDAFDRGAIDDAIQLYQSIEQSDYQSVDLFFNLGTAFVEKRKWAEARYYLEKAILLNPLHEGVKHNLTYVQEQVDDVYHFPHFPFTQTIEYLHGQFGWNTISIMLLIAFLLSLATLWFRPKGWKPIFYSFTTLVLILIGLFLLERNYERTNHEMGVVWDRPIELREIPDELADPLTRVNAGFKVRVLEQLGPWCRVDLADGSEGWMPLQAIRFL